MKKINYILILSVFFTIISCEKEKNNINGSSNSENIDFKSSYQGHVNETYLYSGPTRYILFMDTADFESIIKEKRHNPLSNISASVMDDQSGQQITCNGVSLNSTNNYSGSSFNSIFGTNSVFSVGSSNFELYIPSRIEFVSPFINSNDDLYPFCYYQDFVLKWNEDVNNQHGIIVAVQWNGSMYGEPDRPNEYYRNIDILLDDDGVETLNNDLFQNIPEDAIATMTISRGNVNVFKHQGNTYKLGATTIASLPFRLVRDMSKYN